MRTPILGAFLGVLIGAVILALGGASPFNQQQDVAGLQTDLTQAQADIIALQTKCNAVEASVTTVSAQVGTNTAAIATLTTAATTRQTQLDNLSTTVTTLNTTLTDHLNNLPTGNARPGLGMTWCIATVGIYPSRSLTAPGAGTEISANPYLGSVQLFAGNFAPRGWLKCEGQLLPIAQNTALFSLLGTTYGGDGRTTFGIPDLRGRVPVGVGTGTGLSPVNLGQKLD